jgi:hypothetical protein
VSLIWHHEVRKLLHPNQAHMSNGQFAPPIPRRAALPNWGRLDRTSVFLGVPVNHSCRAICVSAIGQLSEPMSRIAERRQRLEFSALCRRALKSDAALACDTRLFKRIHFVIGERDLVRSLLVVDIR